MSARPSNPAVELDVIVTAMVATPHNYVFRGEGNRLLQVGRVLAGSFTGRGEMLPSPCLAYVVRHPSAGTILIDTGMHPDVDADLREDFGFAMSLLFRNLKPAQTPYEEALRHLGVEPSEVERVVMTHLHVDHTSGMRLLPNASVTVARREWEIAQKPRADTKGFISHHLPPESRVDPIDLPEDGEAHGPFASTLDLLGDGSIRLISTPGHTPGHMSVLLRLAGGTQVLLVGDAAYTRRSIEEQILPLLTDNDDKYRATLTELKRFTELEPDAIVVPSHDPTAWHQLRDVSQSAERAFAEA